jgi:hypothetical protein
MSKTANITEFLNSRKVELASEVIELNIKQDIEKLISSYEASSSRTDNNLDVFYKLIFSAKEKFESSKGDFDKWFSFQKLMKDEKDKALALGKELGIDVTSAPFYKDLLAALNRFDDMYEAFTTANLTYKSIKV